MRCVDTQLKNDPLVRQEYIRATSARDQLLLSEETRIDVAETACTERFSCADVGLNVQPISETLICDVNQYSRKVRYSIETVNKDMKEGPQCSLAHN